MKKIYCYVDETGQDTSGKLFIVTVIITQNKDEVAYMLSHLEIRSGKGKFKWGRAEKTARELYLKDIIEGLSKKIRMYYSHFENTRDYRYSTVVSIARAITHFSNELAEDRRYIVYVDGLGKKDQRLYAVKLHKLYIGSKSVKGVKREESDALIRAADSICGFLRDLQESDEKQMKKLYLLAIRRGILVEV